jgi:hypothetical protein
MPPIRRIVPKTGQIPVRVSDDQVKSCPDLTPEWQQFLAGGGSPRLRPHWEFMRNAETTFARSPALTEVVGWTLMDEPGTVFLVRATRSREDRRIARYEILGAVRPDRLDPGPVLESSGDDVP